MPLVRKEPQGPKIACSVCKKGTLVRRRLRRVSTPVVVIAWIILVASLFFLPIGIIGVLIALLLLMKKDVLQCATCGAAIAAG